MCRLSYKAKVGKDEDCGYLFSARDLCLAKSVNQLARAGVCSFKIEGRLRREGYVATAVQTYRKAVDFASRDRDYIPSKSEMRDLKVVYSRGEYLERAYLDDGTPFVVEKDSITTRESKSDTSNPSRSLRTVCLRYSLFRTMSLKRVTA